MKDKLIKEISDDFLDFEGLEIPKDGIPIICRAMQAYHEAKMKEKAPDKKKECGICTGLIFTVLCPSCKLCSRRLTTRK